MPGTACLVMIGASQAAALTQVAAAARSAAAQRARHDVLGDEPHQVGERGAAADRLGQHQQAGDDQERHGRGRAHSRRVPIST